MGILASPLSDRKTPPAGPIVFPPATSFHVHVVDESYDFGAWTERFPAFRYGEGLSTAQLVAKTAEKLARAEAFMRRMERSAQTWMTCTHPSLHGEFAADADGAARMWAYLRTMGLVDEVADHAIA